MVPGPPDLLALALASDDRSHPGPLIDRPARIPSSVHLIKRVRGNDTKNKGW